MHSSWDLSQDWMYEKIRENIEGASLLCMNPFLKTKFPWIASSSYLYLTSFISCCVLVMLSFFFVENQTHSNNSFCSLLESFLTHHLMSLGNGFDNYSDNDIMSATQLHLISFSRTTTATTTTTLMTATATKQRHEQLSRINKPTIQTAIERTDASHPFEWLSPLPLFSFSTQSRWLKSPRTLPLGHSFACKIHSRNRMHDKHGKTHLMNTWT
jgi:hypothetical protein